MAFRGTEIKPLQKMVVVQVVAKRSRYDCLFGGGGEEGGGGGVLPEPLFDTTFRQWTAMA